jgi:photosystem II stability/assembly factor-like uncharacterized protein
MCVAAVLSTATVCANAQFVGWADGTAGAIVHTSNGGASWSSQNSGSASELRNITFVDPNNGWAVGLGGTILHTVNSGRKFPIVPVENSPTQNSASPTNGRRPSGRGEVQRLPFFHIG